MKVLHTTNPDTEPGPTSLFIYDALDLRLVAKASRKMVQLERGTQNDERGTGDGVFVVPHFAFSVGVQRRATRRR
ncbi:MAG: hypothetical protein GXP41_06110 [Chloroflexi bacterium]|nr:hypothetical protein [Chloroflexota bacterium]